MKQSLTRKQLREIEASLQSEPDAEKQIAILSRAQSLATGWKDENLIIGFLAIVKRRIIRRQVTK